MPKTKIKKNKKLKQKTSRLKKKHSFKKIRCKKNLAKPKQNSKNDKIKNDKIIAKKEVYVEQICNRGKDAYTIFELSKIKEPLNGTPKEVRKELDALALKMQKHPNDNDCFNKIHFYIHKYLLGLVFKKFNFIKGYDENDMYQESLIALFKKAIPKFNPNKGMSFLNFAKMCINRHLITILHASKHRKKDMPINTAISMDRSAIDQDNNEMPPLSNIIPDDNNKTLPYKKMLDKETFSQTLNSIKNKLSFFEIVVLEEYLNEKSYKEVAKGVSKRLSCRYNAKSIDNALLRIRKKALDLLKVSNKNTMPLLF